MGFPHLVFLLLPSLPPTSAPVKLQPMLIASGEALRGVEHRNHPNLPRNRGDAGLRQNCGSCGVCRGWLPFAHHAGK